MLITFFDAMLLIKTTYFCAFNATARSEIECLSPFEHLFTMNLKSMVLLRGTDLWTLWMCGTYGNGYPICVILGLKLMDQWLSDTNKWMERATVPFLSIYVKQAIKTWQSKTRSKLSIPQTNMTACSVGAECVPKFVLDVFEVESSFIFGLHPNTFFVIMFCWIYKLGNIQRSRLMLKQRSLLSSHIHNIVKL